MGTDRPPQSSPWRLRAQGTESGQETARSKSPDSRPHGHQPGGPRPQGAGARWEGQAALQHGQARGRSPWPVWSEAPTREGPAHSSPCGRDHSRRCGPAPRAGDDGTQLPLSPAASRRSWPERRPPARPHSSWEPISSYTSDPDSLLCPHVSVGLTELSSFC